MATIQHAITLAQLDFTVGDIRGNTHKIIDAAKTAIEQYQSELIIFPELALTSYPPEDLLLRKDFYFYIEAAINELCLANLGIDIIVGYPRLVGGLIYNAAGWIRNGKLIAEYHKHELPNYGVFDEKRYFSSGNESVIVEWKGIRVGLLICEDLWYSTPIQQAKQAKAELIISLNASPFTQQKSVQRQKILTDRCQESNLPIIYVNHMGGQDDLLFDGDSMVMNTDGSLALQIPAFTEKLATVLFDKISHSFISQPLALQDPLAVVYQGLVIAVRDYVNKNGFPGVLLGLSGGIDSALVLAIAVDALGKDRVQAVMIPSRYTASISQEDAFAEARNLGVHYSVISLETIFSSFLTALAPSFSGLSVDTTEENLQARIRGTLLMALSNKTGRLVLTTGNKSEMAVGYATLYGDMAGGFDVLKDVVKTLVYQLANYRNRVSPVIPQRVIDRPPSAELAPDQKDQDSLPPYEILDEIIALFVEQDLSLTEIVARGFDLDTVKKVVGLIHRNEYKRQQAPPGPRITERAFERNRRYPITSKFLTLL